MPINFMSRGYTSADLISTALGKAQESDTTVATVDAQIQTSLYTYWQNAMQCYAQWSVNTNTPVVIDGKTYYSDGSVAPYGDPDNKEDNDQSHQYWNTEYQTAQATLNGNGNIDDAATQAATGAATNCSDQLSSQLALASFLSSAASNLTSVLNK